MEQPILSILQEFNDILTILLVIAGTRCCLYYRLSLTFHALDGERKG